MEKKMETTMKSTVMALQAAEMVRRDKTGDVAQ